MTPDQAPLSGSKWANATRSMPRRWSAQRVDSAIPAVAQTTITGSNRAANLNDPELLARMLSRLYWKASTVTCSYARAVQLQDSYEHDSDARHQHDVLWICNGLIGARYGEESKDEGQVAQIARNMFKLDFFEFYVILERVLVLSLARMNIKVARGVAEAAAGHSASPASTTTFGRTAVEATHRFHANILETLERDDCELKPVLGTGSPIAQLHLAKAMRNRWKDADEQGNRHDVSEDELLRGLDLQQMLTVVLPAVKQAKELVDERATEPMDVEMEEAVWEALEDDEMDLG